MAELAVEKKKIVLSGIQPSGNQFTLGNYIGAIRNWANMQDEFNCIYMVANEHSITVRQEPAKLRKIPTVRWPVCWLPALIRKRACCLSRPTFLLMQSWPGS